MDNTKPLVDSPEAKKNKTSFLQELLHPQISTVYRVKGGMDRIFLIIVIRFPIDGKVKFVHHQNGNYHKAWLPKASEENEHSDIMITTPDGEDVLVRQIAGALARRIVTYAKEGEDCYIDEHLGFIKLGSRVDVFLPLTAKACVTMGQPTTGDQTVIAKMK